ncbi:hypothetical protein VH571_16090 [Frondihabitans sp. 4ASC-45]|jgi:hypothetical protein|uniref:hypothetical protein n=1 Tax=Frondihabitans sp. 4ASC-45 TaxID=3111636 RepID=UPI003C298B3B
MSKIKDRLLNRLVRTDVALRERVEKLREDQEAGLEQATWTAIVAVGGAVLAIAIIGLVTAFATGYLGKLPG